MDANSQYELYLIKKELQSIINELYSISGGVRSDFDGIGNEKCANSVVVAAQYYETVLQHLNNMDTSALSDEFLERKRQEEARARAAEEQKKREAEAKKKEEEAKRKEAEAQRKKEEEANNNQSSKSNSKNDSKKKDSDNILEAAIKWILG